MTYKGPPYLTYTLQNTINTNNDSTSNTSYMSAIQCESDYMRLWYKWHVRELVVAVEYKGEPDTRLLFYSQPTWLIIIADTLWSLNTQFYEGVYCYHLRAVLLSCTVWWLFSGSDVLIANYVAICASWALLWCYHRLLSLLWLVFIKKLRNVVMRNVMTRLIDPYQTHVVWRILFYKSIYMMSDTSLISSCDCVGAVPVCNLVRVSTYSISTTYIFTLIYWLPLNPGISGCNVWRFQYNNAVKVKLYAIVSARCCSAFVAHT